VTPCYPTQHKPLPLLGSAGERRDFEHFSWSKQAYQVSTAAAGYANRWAATIFEDYT